jgi:hypothetical protein
MSGFSEVTITGNYGVGAAGTVTFTLTLPMANGGQIMLPAPIIAQVVNGLFSVQLAANDDALTVPPGTFWGVTEQIAGAQPRDYFITVPSASAGGSIGIDTLMPGQVGWS